MGRRDEKGTSRRHRDRLLAGRQWDPLGGSSRGPEIPWDAGNDALTGDDGRRRTLGGDGDDSLDGGAGSNTNDGARSGFVRKSITGRGGCNEL
jgi:hypothetical protein